MRSTLRLLAHTGFVFVAVIGVLSDGEAQVPSSGLTASVGVRVTPYRQSGRPGGAAVSTDVRPGESKRVNLTAGDGDDLCVTGVWASEPGVVTGPAFQSRINEQEAAAHYVWRFDVTMHEIATDRIVFDLFWERLSRSRPNDPLRGRQRVTVRENESYPVDLVHDTRNSDCLSVFVDVVAQIGDESGLQGKTLEWDVWFSGPQSAAIHRSVTSPHGETAPFQFAPMPLTITQPDRSAVTTTVNIYGYIRARVRRDGYIDVALTAHRFVSSNLNRTRPPQNLARVGNSGQKNFVIRPGEAVKIVLPSMNTAPPVQFQTDPVTGNRTVRAVPRPAQSASSSDPNEMSITIQARVR